MCVTTVRADHHVKFAGFGNEIEVGIVELEHLDVEVKSNRSGFAGFEGDALDLELRPGFDSPDGRLMLRLRGVPVLLQRGGRELVFPDGIYALPEPSAPLRILADRGSVELFCGRFHCGLNTPLDPGKRGLEILTQEHCRPEGTLSRLRSVWPQSTG